MYIKGWRKLAYNPTVLIYLGLPKYRPEWQLQMRRQGSEQKLWQLHSGRIAYVQDNGDWARVVWTFHGRYSGFQFTAQVRAEIRRVRKNPFSLEADGHFEQLDISCRALVDMNDATSDMTATLLGYSMELSCILSSCCCLQHSPSCREPSWGICTPARSTVNYLCNKNNHIKIVHSTRHKLSSDSARMDPFSLPQPDDASSGIIFNSCDFCVSTLHHKMQRRIHKRSVKDEQTFEYVNSTV